MKRRDSDTATGITLKEVAAYVGFSQATVSVVLNRVPQAGTTPPQTQEKIFAAARKLNYRPNPIARALRTRATGNVPPMDVHAYQAVLLPESRAEIRPGRLWSSAGKEHYCEGHWDSRGKSEARIKSRRG